MGRERGRWECRRREALGLALRKQIDKAEDGKGIDVSREVNALEMGHQCQSNSS